MADVEVATDGGGPFSLPRLREALPGNERRALRCGLTNNAEPG
jgi:hypothetical protein